MVTNGLLPLPMPPPPFLQQVGPSSDNSYNATPPPARRSRVPAGHGWAGGGMTAEVVC